ncbi:hypothetical protein R3I93_011411 [Phoxinus phoxinus]|uniref:Rho-GAP domain-containing protein n=1 Tax=Phoxinus phoxinus TaxID=58324 RepID=A0AAN9CY26_9TELE
MKVLERNVVRLAVVQHLRSVYGIKIKNWNKNRNKQTSANTVRVFGVALDGLPHCHVLDYGDVPCFIVDACACLMDHLDTEGLFRKSGSVVRVKSLRAKLEQGEDGLPTALPLDIAGLLKQFFRELPEPLLSADLHSGFLKAQELPSEEERTSATLLLSCVLPDRNLNTLRYFFSFLKTVSQRCAENKMDSSNLSVIFAPNLFHCGDGGEKMSSNTEKRLKLQAAALQCLIENAQRLGAVPQFLMEKVPAMLGCDAGVFSPASVSLEESNALSDLKKSNRRSLGVFSTATPGIITPNSKRKLPLDSAHTHGFSSKKRRSIKKNLGLELFPNALFGGSSTPGSAHSAAGALDASRSGVLSSVGRNSRLSCSSARRKSRRRRDRSVNRVESGKAGCFSPRAAKKEPVRKSLRLRFSLGKSSRESNLITHSQLGPKGSEVIGWRLATQESCTGFHFTKELSPTVLKKSPSKGSRFLSKSEDDLLTPRCESLTHRSSWSRDTPDVGLTDSFSETQPPTVSGVPKILSAEESFGEQRSGSTLLKVRRAFGESGSDLHSAIKPQNHDLLGSTSSETSQRSDHNVTFGQIEMLPMSPLHIDSTLFDSGTTRFGGTSLNESLFSLENESKDFLKEERCSAECSQLVDALDMQSPVAFRLDSSKRIQSTPYGSRAQANTDTSSLGNMIDEDPVETCDMMACPYMFRTDSRVQSTPYGSRAQAKTATSSLGNIANVPSAAETRRMKVAEQIKLFNMMTLDSPKAKVVRSPMKFQRTPVRQSVRRLNSLVGSRKEARMGWCAAATQIKAVSLETALHSTFAKPKPPVPPKKAKVRPATLEDVTNKTPKTKRDKNGANEHPKSVLLEVSGNETSRYRGSPRNPLAEGKLLSALKPIDI